VRIAHVAHASTAEDLIRSFLSPVEVPPNNDGQQQDKSGEAPTILD